MEVVLFKHYSFSYNVAISKRLKKLSMFNLYEERLNCGLNCIAGFFIIQQLEA